MLFDETIFKHSSLQLQHLKNPANLYPSLQISYVLNIQE